ncbi:MAG: DUF167 domain-containing protein [Gemmatimonadota bacterium]
MSGLTEGAIKAVPGGIRLLVLVQPRASITSLAGMHGERLKIRLAAPPVDGAANEALVVFLTRLLQVNRSAVSIKSGQSSRRKTLVINGISVERAKAILGG